MWFILAYLTFCVEISSGNQAITIFILQSSRQQHSLIRNHNLYFCLKPFLFDLNWFSITSLSKMLYLLVPP